MVLLYSQLKDTINTIIFMQLHKNHLTLHINMLLYNPGKSLKFPSLMK